MDGVVQVVFDGSEKISIFQRFNLPECAVVLDIPSDLQVQTQFVLNACPSGFWNMDENGLVFLWYQIE